MPTPKKVKRHGQQHVSIDTLLDVFCIQFGYKDRDEIQIRLEKDGTIYVCDARESRRLGEPRMISGRVPWELFEKEWPEFVRYLLAKKHKAAAQAAEGE